MSAGLLVIWIGGVVIAERGWVPVYVGLAGIVVLARVSGAFRPGDTLTIAVCAAVGAVAVLVVVAVVTTRRSDLRPCSWPRAMFSAVVAGGLGLLIWLLPVASGYGVRYALYYAAVPLMMAFIGSTWAASRLDGFWHFAPRVFAETDLNDNATDVVRGVYRNVLGGAAGRLFGIWGLALVAILVLGAFTSLRPELVDVLELLMLVFGITTLGVETALLDTFHKPAAALTAVGAAVGTVLVLDPYWSRPVVIAAGTVIGIVLASALLARQVRHSPLIFITPLA